MENKFKFNSTREFRSHNFKERPQDVLVDNKSIFENEKTPAQKEVIKTAFRLLDEHIKELGIEIPHPFDQKRIIFMPVRNIEEGIYHEGDFVFMSQDSEGNLETIIHELSHAYSSEWRNYEEAKLENYLKEQKRRDKVKSGFHVAYSKSTKTDIWKMEDDELPQINFPALNEGITEKIAREIISKNETELERLKPLFAGRLEKKLEEKEKEFNSITLPEVKSEIEEKQKKYEEELSQLELKMNTLEKDLDIEITKESDTKEKKFLESMKEIKLSPNKLEIKWKKEEIQELPREIEYAKKSYLVELADLKKNYSFSSLEHGVYDFEVSVVDKIAKGLAKTYFKENPSSDVLTEENRAWRDLQKAYFTGKTVFLRKIEKTFGAGFLRSVQKLSPLTTGEEKEKFLADIQESINKI